MPVKFVEAVGFAAATSSIALTGCYSSDMAAGGSKAFVAGVAAAALSASDAETVAFVAGVAAAAPSASVAEAVAFDDASDFASVPKIAVPHCPYSRTCPCR